jgi:hypothetical protein
MMRLRLPALWSLVAWTVQAQAAEPVTPVTLDPRVQAALQAAKLTYSVDAGDFRLRFDLDASRSQVVWVASGTWKVEDYEIRDVWSVAARGQGRVPAELASHLLTENARMILGSWQVNQGSDEYLVVFSASVPATVDADTLREVIEVVALSTDRIEKELGPQDEF